MKTHNSSSFIFFFTMLCFFNTSAQIENLDFVLTSNQVEISGVEENISSSITKSQNTITWIQQNNGIQDTSIFDITAITGVWNSVENIGTVHYELDYDGYRGLMIIKSTDTGIIAHITIYINDTTHSTYSFNTNSISYL